MKRLFIVVLLLLATLSIGWEGKGWKAGSSGYTKDQIVVFAQDSTGWKRVGATIRTIAGVDSVHINGILKVDTLLVTWAFIDTNYVTIDSSIVMKAATIVADSLNLENGQVIYDKGTNKLTVSSLVATTADVNGGTIDGATIGGSTPGAGSFTNAKADSLNLEAGQVIYDKGLNTLKVNTANIDGGTIDGTTIGGSTPGAGSFTTTKSDSLNLEAGQVIYDKGLNKLTASNLAATSAVVGGGSVTADAGLTVNQSGVKTDHTTSLQVNNTATNATINKIKYGASISSTGTWTGAGAGVNTALRLDATGGTTNYAVHAGSGSIKADDGLTANTADINGGTVDGADIGVSTPGVGKFTTMRSDSIGSTDNNVIYDNGENKLKVATQITGGGASTGDEKLTVNQSGAKSDDSYAEYINNTATSSTGSKYKYGLRVESTGTWNGTSAGNRALYLNATGGTTNWAIYSAAGTWYCAGNLGIGLAANPYHYLSIADVNGNNPSWNVVNTTYNKKRISAATAIDTSAFQATIPSGIPQFYMANATGQNGTFGYTSGQDYFNIANAGLTIGTPTTPTGQLHLNANDAEFAIENTTAEDGSANRDVYIKHYGLTSTSVRHSLGYIKMSHYGTSNDQCGRMDFYLNDSNDGTTPSVAMLSMGSNSGASNQSNFTGYVGFGVGLGNASYPIDVITTSATAAHLNVNAASNSSINNVLKINRSTSHASNAAAGIGGSIDWYLEDASGNSEDVGMMEISYPATPTHNSEIADFTWRLARYGIMASAGTVPVIPQMRLTGLGYLGINTNTPLAKLHVTQQDIDEPLIISSPSKVELITSSTDRDFTGGAGNWTLGSGWAYGTNNVVHTTGTADLSLTSSSYLTSGSIVSGNTYVIKFTISGLAGTITSKLGTVSSSTIVANGTYSMAITAAANNANIIFTPSSAAVTIDDISVQLIQNSTFVIDSNNRIGIGTQTPQHQASIVGSTPQLNLVDSDVNKKRTSAAAAIDTSSIKLDASLGVYPQVIMHNSTGRATEYGMKAYHAQGFADSSVALVMSQNAYKKISNAASDLWTNSGTPYNITEAGDSITVLLDGDYEVFWDVSLTGANTDLYNLALFISDSEQAGKGECFLTPTSTEVYVASGHTIFFDMDANQVITLRIRNTANNNDATVKTGNIVVQRIGE